MMSTAGNRSRDLDASIRSRMMQDTIGAGFQNKCKDLGRTGWGGFHRTGPGTGINGPVRFGSHVSFLMAEQTGDTHLPGLSGQGKLTAALHCHAYSSDACPTRSCPVDPVRRSSSTPRRQLRIPPPYRHEWRSCRINPHDSACAATVRCRGVEF